MPRLTFLLLQAAIIATPLAAQAQDWRDDDGGRGYDRAPRVFWDGNCRVTQRVNSDGELVERRRCRGDGAAHARAARADDDAPRYADDDRGGRYESRRGAERYPDYAEARPRQSDERDSRRYGDNYPAPVYASEPAPAPRVILRAEPAPRPARIVAQAVPVVVPNAVKPVVQIPKAPLAVTTTRVAPKASAPVARTAAPLAPRVAVRPAPVAKPVRIAAWVAPGQVVTKPKLPVFQPKVASRIEPAAAPAKAAAQRIAVRQPPKRLIVRAEPAPARLPVEVKKPRLVLAIAAAPKAPVIVAKAAPAPAKAANPAKPTAVLAKVTPATVKTVLAAKPVVTRVTIAATPAPVKTVLAAKLVPVKVAVAATPAPVKVAVAAKPAVLVAAVQPKVAAPRVAAAVAVPVEPAKPTPAPVVKTSGSKQKSEWLVLLAGESAKETVEAKVEAPADLDNSEPIVQSRVYAKGESYLKSTAYREYVMRKSSDPYSNLK